MIEATCSIKLFTDALHVFLISKLVIVATKSSVVQTIVIYSSTACSTYTMNIDTQGMNTFYDRMMSSIHIILL